MHACVFMSVCIAQTCSTGKKARSPIYLHGCWGGTVFPVTPRREERAVLSLSAPAPTFLAVSWVVRPWTLEQCPLLTFCEAS